MPYRIGLNGHLLSLARSYRGAGINGYIIQLLRHLPKADPRLVYTAYYYDPAYNSIADLNEDGIVDLYDLTIVSYYYGVDC